MQKAVISPLNNVTFKGGDQHSEGGDQHSELNNVTFKGGDQHSEGGDQQKKTSLLGLLSEPKIDCNMCFN